MNVKSLVLDYGLPGLVVLTTGIATYMLTGGPEEFPSTEDVQPDGSDALGEADDMGEESLDENNDQVAVADNQPPAWATELAEYTKALSDEVRLLKEASQANMQLQQEQYRLFLNQQRNTVCPECQGKKSDPATVSTDATPLIEEKPWTLADWQNQLRWNILRMAFPADGDVGSVFNERSVLTFVQQKLFACSDETTVITATDTAVAPTTATETDLAAACDLLIMYFNNLLKNPTVPRYRRMSTINSSYAKSLSTVQHHTAVLTAVGFLQKADSTYYEYEWHALPTMVEEVTASEDTSSKTKKPESSRSAPATVGDARALLEEAVQLLGALKVSRTALLRALQAKLSEQHTVTATVAVSDTTQPAGQEPTNSKLAPADSAPVAATSMQLGTESGSNVNPSNHSAAAATSTLSDVAGYNAPFQPDQLLISVADVTEGEARLLGGGSASESASDNLDFMKILRKAQEAAGSGLKAP